MDFFLRFYNESGVLFDDRYDIDYYLKPYGARNVVGEPYIEFETEEQAVLFVLRWS